MAKMGEVRALMRVIAERGCDEQFARGLGLARNIYDRMAAKTMMTRVGVGALPDEALLPPDCLEAFGQLEDCHRKLGLVVE